ncbi:peptide chain release factor N(5)-glutamine methyltransferase [Chachezhania antarctica]|uniref:peptide chain release factor N(5)-glutamine methyltransferase n=1 Tax=Chachezhania antarctica TaxID=2340860 RepID=UPI000EAC785B|nr:peptide chain release factor N(5)-glutamine methyltransferase [Chachezhania antarctica]|tara:strand:+ start:1418 stop:2251 length:834 start_codon:yes stop_codon:yes gene_type:complete
MTAGEALARAASRLREAGVADPVRDARRLLAFAAQTDAARITLIAPEEMDPVIAERFDRFIEMRETRIPVSQIVGERQFYGRPFNINRDVLDPRPETEILIEAALAEPFLRILDLGTGSGCILATLLAERPDAVGLGVDVSEAACLQASANIVRHGLTWRAQIQQMDWYGTIDRSYDLIVSNPPYLAHDEMEDLQPEVKNFEPAEALTDFGDGLGAYRIIIAGAPRRLEPGGRLIVEIGPTQGAAVAALMEAAYLAGIEVIPDMDGRDRVVLGRRNI